MHSTKQNRPRHLEMVRPSYERGACEAAFLAQADALPRRPEPRRPWDEVARRDGSIPHPGWRCVALSKHAARAAIESRDPIVMRVELAAIEHYYETMKRDATRELRAAISEAPPLPVDDALRSAHKEGVEALDAMFAAKGSPSKTLRERVCKEAREGAAALLELVRSLAHADGRTTGTVQVTR